MIRLEKLLEKVDFRIIYPFDKGNNESKEEMRGVLNKEVSDVTDRSSECGKGSVFVCLKGRKSDGHSYIEDALRAGAETVLCHAGSNVNIEGIAASFPYACIIETENTRSAFAKMCASFYGISDGNIKIICVTGTNGKTTVSTLIYRALNSCGKPTALLGTLGGYFGDERFSCGTMTTPDPKQLYGLVSRFGKMGAEYLVIEASSHALALNKLDGLDIYMGVFTNLTPEHLDFHGSMEEYASAKSLLFRRCSLGGVFFADDAYCRLMAEALPEGRRAIRCSVIDSGADYYADNVRMLGEDGVRYSVLHTEVERKMRMCRTDIYCGIPGSFSVCNSLLAFATLCELGISPVCAAGGIISSGGVRGRIEKLSLPDRVGFSVYIDFAHTPDALSKIIRSVREFAAEDQRIITVFGCGGDRDRSKRPLMGAISSRLADFTVLTADNSRSESTEEIISEILSGFDKARPYKIIPDRKEAIIFALESAEKGDIILLCGKGHEEYEIIGDSVIPFSEREIVEEYFNKNKSS
ncbi:MAG: UDP-N-acetylmuramoyl-L-alanyl-D-glutamate--2,6-diaminopimelate ligase [Clostridia bacterium]|nr:UDP-N-acetylmuramoyl-L-alanyl-D-glutamate--2,6-diaminopimelate ligase [Clostridia bacterium]